MPESLEVALAGAVLRLELSDAGEPVPDVGSVQEEEGEGPRPDLPEGFGTVAPVSAWRGRTPVIDAERLRSILSPLGPLLEEVHRSVTGVADPPQQLSVSFGVEVGRDLKVSIVGVNRRTTMTVSATWDVDDARRS